MNPAITVAAIAGAVSAVGWIVTYILTARADRRKARLSAKLAHIERQLSELYGPLAFLIHEGTASFKDLLETVGRPYIFVSHKPLADAELQMWLFWVDFDFMPRNATIQALLSSKSHLIVGDELPQSYKAFLDHYNSWRVTHARWKQEGVPYSWHSKTNWPAEFDDEVIATYRRLMKEHATLIGTVTRA